VVFDLPSELTSVHVAASGHPAPFFDAPSLQGNVSVGDAAFKRYTAPIELFEGVFRGGAILYAVAPGSVGRFLRMGYYVEWEGGRQPERWLDIETVSIPAGGTPQKPPLYLCHADYNWTIPRLPAHADTIKRVGLKGLEVWDIVGFNDRRLKVFNFLRERGLEALGTFSPGYWYPFHTALKTDPDMQARGMDGQPIAGKGGFRACPSYRGPNYQKQMDLLRSYALYGLDTVTFDEEFFGPGPRICYCARCKGLFREYMKKHHPGVPELTMEEIGAVPEKHPAHARAWAQFKADCVTDWYRDYRAALEDGWKKVDPKRKVTMYVTDQVMSTGAGPGPDSVEFISCMRDNVTRLREGIIQGLMPMAYLYSNAYEGSVRRVGDEYRLQQRMWGPYVGGQRTLFPYFLAGGGEMCFLQPQRAIKYTLYEAMTTGSCMGGVIYHMNGMDGYHWKYLAEALHTIAKVEDILAAGTVQDLDCAPSDARARAVVLDREAVIMVSHYDYDPVTVTVQYQPQRECLVVDAETGEKIAALTPASTSFRLSIDKDRVRLLRTAP
jgi:hypothetical protein